ncbi:hypothetical protein [Pseudomonas sp. Teo4]|uniref:hypothetical protein n=1 Tax=Pseudomonas sp. Teo4 TaxID=3064528 RepID=UPI002ACB1323|nr:hypothetical protein [Pseudomonas sp. Teo4]
MKAKYLSIMRLMGEAFNDKCVNLVIFRTAVGCKAARRSVRQAVQHFVFGDGRHLDETVLTEKNDARAQGGVDPAWQAGDE